MKAKTFRDAYDTLQSHAQTLRNQSEPNIDDLLTIVNESVAAYKICKERIDAVEKALEAALVSADIAGAVQQNPALGASESVDATWSGSGTSEPDIDGSDEDIPF